MQESYVSSNGNMMDLDRVIKIKAFCLFHQNKDVTIIIVGMHKINSGALAKRRVCETETNGSRESH